MIAGGQLILDLNDAFIQHEGLRDVHAKLLAYSRSKQQQLGDPDINHIAQYLSLFTVIYSLKTRRVLDLSTIDRSFSSWFFLAVNNPFIQHHIMSEPERYQALITLYEQWLKFLRKQKLSEPYKEHSLSILLGRRKNAKGRFNHK